MTGSRLRNLLSIIAICIILNSFFLGISPIGDLVTEERVVEDLQQGSSPRDSLSLDSHENQRTADSSEEAPIDFRSQLEAYNEIPQSLAHYSLTGNTKEEEGLVYTYEISGSTLRIRVSINSYAIVTYSFEEGEFQSVMIPGTQQSTVYGSPVVPYKNLLIDIPDYTLLTGVDTIGIESEWLPAMDIVPGPKPVAIYEGFDPDAKLFFDPDFYDQDSYLDSEIATYRVVRQGNDEGLLLTIKPFQYNPVKGNGVLNSEFVIEVTLDAPITFDDLTFNGGSGSGVNYTIIIQSGFETAIADFVTWKTLLGFNVFVETLDDIYATYSGYDSPEKIRNFIHASYAANHTSYVFLIGDGDIVPVREVVDPYIGPGLDNGTEPTDLYYECLDGNWDDNGNHQYGELDDEVDFFPEIMVGRIPVQTYEEAERVLSLIVQYESNPVSGDWMDNFMLIANDCFGYGDGPVMTEGELNQKYLYDSFFDVSRFYSTDGSLMTSNIVSAINSGVGIIDFFDHGAYDQWSGALMTDDVLGLTNGDMPMFAFAMACETAAFDYELGEPVIAEAFFRNPNGGAAAYIGATRVAWASSDAFDGFHNVFWDYFLREAITEREVNPKMAFQDALNFMVTTFDMSSAATLETVYQAIYFGDPSMNMYWKQNFTTEASEVDIEETVELNGTCLSYNNVPFADAHVVVTVTDPMGAVVTSSPVITDSLGHYSISFETSNRPGKYSVRTQVADPFDYTGVTSFNVGSVAVTLQLNSEPIYHTYLQFSGTASVDCSGNASLIDSGGSIIQTSSFSVSGGAYSSFLNLTAFGDLRLYIQLDNGFTFGGTETNFRVNRGDILIIADDTGTDYIDYPGGWADDNVGDSSNQGDLDLALKDEYNVTIFYPRYEQVPSISYLHGFDAVFVTTGDNVGFPLNSPSSYLLDVLNQYHNEGGNILFEGASILTALDGYEDERFPNLFHVEYVDYTENTGALELVKSTHPIMSGMPSSVLLDDGLGTVYADIFYPYNESIHAAAYGGSYVGGTAISGLAPGSGRGGVVFIGFSIDAITNRATRDLLVKNAAAFLLQPSLIVTLSDDALQTGTSETIYFEVADAATDTPVKGAAISMLGCGISALNTTQPDGTCSIFINPSSEGVITVNVTKGGYLNFTTDIMVYDTPIVALQAAPSFLRPYETQTVTITATDYFEYVPLVSCYITANGLGNSVFGYTNSSGMLDLTLTPNDAGIIYVNGELSGYIGSVIGIPVRFTVVVLPSYGTMYPEEFIWDHLMNNWESYGEMPLYIDYTTFATESVTLEKLEELDADVLYLGYQTDIYSSAEINAIKSYTEAGHGLVISSTALYLNPEWDSFLGLVDDITMDAQYFDPLTINILDTEHPLFVGVSNPYVPYFGGTIYPLTSFWDGSVLQGASYLAQDSVGYAAILTYHGIVYFSNLPEYMGHSDDCQLVYNAILWSEYVIPEHDLAVSLEAPQQSNPGEAILLNVTVHNKGLFDETDVTARLLIDGLEVDSLDVSLLEAGISTTFQYTWTPTIESMYILTAVVDPVAGEDSYANNEISQWVNIKLLKNYLMVEGIYNWYDAVANGVNLGVYGDDTYVAVTLPFLFPYYDDFFGTVYVSSNGWLSFTNSYPYDYVNPEFPSSNPAYAYCMAPAWDDLQARSNIYLWETPERVVIQFDDYEYLGGTAIGTFQVVLHINGLIEFNYLTMYTVYDATIGLNHGDGIHFNSYPASSLSGASELGLQFVSQIPEHDLSASLLAPEVAWIGVSVDITATVVNTGNNTEYDIFLTLFIDDLQIDLLYIPMLDPFESESLVYKWTPSAAGFHNIAVFVEATPEESSTRNNAMTRLVYVEEPRGFSILSPTTSEIVSGGTVFVEYEADAIYDLDHIDIYVNGEYTTTVNYLGRPEFMVPVFQNGTNEISIFAWWWDMSSSFASVTFQSVDVVPIVRPESGDYYNWITDYGMYQYHRNYTFGEMVSTFEVEVDVVEAWFEHGELVDTYYGTLYVNILNGYISNDTMGGIGMHLFFLSCLNSPISTGTGALIDDPMVWNTWSDVYYVSSYTIWNGYAVWTLFSEVVGGHIAVFRSNGIAAHDEDGAVVDTSFFPVEDTSAPVWVSAPSVIYAEAGEDLSHQFEVFDETGINTFSVNNSLFRVTLNGLLTNHVDLDVGVYHLALTVIDPYGHTLTGVVTVIVQDTTPPAWLDYYVNITIHVGDVLQLRVSAYDYSGIDHYSVNDTRFTMNAEGWLSSVIQLGVGSYPLLVSVYDIYDNMNTMAIEVIVTEEGGLPSDMLVVIMVGVFTLVAVSGFIVILLIRKRLTAGSG